MSFLRTLVVLLTLPWGGFAFAQPASVRHTTPVAGVYAGAIVVDAATGRVLVEDNADVRNPPASMTKLMTFAVVHDRLSAGTLTLQTPVKIEAADARMGGTQVTLNRASSSPSRSCSTRSWSSRPTMPPMRLRAPPPAPCRPSST